MSDINLYQGDCLEVMRSFTDKSISCIITDPPYAVGFKNDFYDDTPEAVFPKIPLWFKEWYRILKDGSHVFVFVGVKTLHKWIQEGMNARFEYKNVIATRGFNNGSPTPKNSFGYQFQPIIHFTKGKGRSFNDVDFYPTSKEWFKDKRNKNPKPYTYEYSNFIPTTITYATEKRSTKNLHPNEKNIKLLSFLVGIATDEKSVVLDPFMGSGTTGVACKKTNRNFIGIELDENYFKIAEERIDDVFQDEKR